MKSRLTRLHNNGPQERTSRGSFALNQCFCLHPNDWLRDSSASFMNSTGKSACSESATSGRHFFSTGQPDPHPLMNLYREGPCPLVEHKSCVFPFGNHAPGQTLMSTWEGVLHKGAGKWKVFGFFKSSTFWFLGIDTVFRRILRFSRLDPWVFQTPAWSRRSAYGAPLVFPQPHASFGFLLGQVVSALGARSSGFGGGFRGFRGERLCWWGLDTFALGWAMLQELQKLLALKDELGPGHPEFWMGGGCFSVDSDGPSAENSWGLSPVAFILFHPSFFLTNQNFWGNWSRKQGHVGPKMAPGLLLVPSEKGSPGSKDTF